MDIIRRACEEPVRQITGNAGLEGAIIIEKIRANKDVNCGFNAQTEVYEDLVKAGVIDPTKVTRSALQHASSISALMLTTEAMICEIPEKKPPAAAMTTAAWAVWAEWTCRSLRDGIAPHGAVAVSQD